MRSEQEAWLEAELRAAAGSGAKHVVLLSHMAPFMGDEDEEQVSAARADTQRKGRPLTLPPSSAPRPHSISPLSSVPSPRPLSVRRAHPLSRPPRRSPSPSQQGYFNWATAPRKRVLELAERAGVSLWLCGHYHTNCVVRSRGGVEVVTTSSCAGVINWSKAPHEMAVYRSHTHGSLLTLTHTQTPRHTHTSHAVHTAHTHTSHADHTAHTW